MNRLSLDAYIADSFGTGACGADRRPESSRPARAVPQNPFRFLHAARPPRFGLGGALVACLILLAVFVAMPPAPAHGVRPPAGWRVQLGAFSERDPCGEGEGGAGAVARGPGSGRWAGHRRFEGRRAVPGGARRCLRSPRRGRRHVRRDCRSRGKVLRRPRPRQGRGHVERARGPSPSGACRAQAGAVARGSDARGHLRPVARTRQFSSGSRPWRRKSANCARRLKRSKRNG